eukprot:m.54239 g.54239  ORF g.54239 m.54239 type:complete len:82 (+) comp10912_c0_seq4:153-398(+)
MESVYEAYISNVAQINRHLDDFEGQNIPKDEVLTAFSLTSILLYWGFFCCLYVDNCFSHYYLYLSLLRKPIKRVELPHTEL